jgi:hypothetical protein
VSGEPVVILAGEAMVRLITAAARLAEAPLGPYAIIGGVAVSWRLGQAHRATADLDAVADDATPPPAIEVLSQLPSAEPDPDSPHRVVVEGIKVEIQGTEPFRPEQLDGLTDKQTRYALESATPVTLLARDGDVRATVPVATARGASCHEAACHPGPPSRRRAGQACQRRLGHLPPASRPGPGTYAGNSPGFDHPYDVPSAPRSDRCS